MHSSPLPANLHWFLHTSEDQAKGESPAHHLERAKASAVARGWTVKEVYDLAGISGKSVKEHPEARLMMDDIKRHHITGIIFSKLARLARNTKELLEFSEYFRDHQADLVSLQDSIDTSTPSGRMFYTFQAAQPNPNGKFWPAFCAWIPRSPKAETQRRGSMLGFTQSKPMERDGSSQPDSQQLRVWHAFWDLTSGLMPSLFHHAPGDRFPLAGLDKW